MLKTCHSLQINKKGSSLSNNKTVRLLGVTVDPELSFEPHLIDVCKKVSQKFHALATVSKFILQKKLKVIVRAVTTS